MIKDDILKTESIYVWSTASDEVYQKTHCHAEYELYYFIQGNIERHIEGRWYIMTPESLMLIPANHVHGVSIKTTAMHKRISIHFPPELLDEAERALLLEVFHSPQLYYSDLSATRMDFLFQSVMDCKNMDKGLQNAALKHRIISLLTYIFQIYSKNLPHASPRDERIQGVLRYLNNNLCKPVSLDQLSREFYISKNHLNLIFRRETGTTINQYIRMKRLTQARQEIRNGYTAEEAAYKVGFNDYSNFYRAYKTFFGLMPSDKANEWPQIPQGVLFDNNEE
ncbi:MAG: AraC family transcriptional regulator [Spirochaetaceae bacterium]|jgi:AraC-like DNA-binding protein|nr:AraC family transcriptional regulator [Spirochaetaceae bacterium]